MAGKYQDVIVTLVVILLTYLVYRDTRKKTIAYKNFWIVATILFPPIVIVYAVYSALFSREIVLSKKQQIEIARRKEIEKKKRIIAAEKEALEKLKLNDASLEYQPEVSKALGFGFRCGFLGLLHMDIIMERITREFDIDVISTSPSVIYEVELTNGDIEMIDSPNKMPDRAYIKEIREPFIKTNILVPSEYIGAIMELCQDKRGIYINMEYIDPTRVNIHYELPLSEIVYDFFDKLKSTTKGYASFDYEVSGYKRSDLVKMDILINGEIVDALSLIVHKDFAYDRGKSIVSNLRTIIPRQLFQVPIQASIGSKVIARENISARSKNVLAKCYGGDVSRKRKLLDKQKEGKKRMKMVGTVEIPQEAFMLVLKADK